MPLLDAGSRASAPGPRSRSQNAPAPEAGRDARGARPARGAGSARGPAAGRARRSGLAASLGLVPFAAYVLLFLAIPTALAVLSGLFDREGNLTAHNLAALVDPAVLATFASSFWISLLTAGIGAIVGAAACYGLLAFPPSSPLRACVDAVSGVLAQFSGVMLAFAFIATIGVQGLVTVALRDVLGLDIYASGVWLYQVPGLILPYLYFQIPLMIITFMPALSGLKPQWAEASATLGAGALAYWRRVGIPVLAPAFAGGFLLLFANAFSAFGTAAALISQGSQIVPLQIRAALVSETLLGRENLAGALALGMIAVMAVLMTAYSALQSRTQRWQR